MNWAQKAGARNEPVRVGAASVLVQTNGAADTGLGEGGRQGDLYDG